MISKRALADLRKAKLGEIAIYNGEYMHGDGTPLSAKDKEKVLAIMAKHKTIEKKK